jgi:5-formyltetrahydrofolate cyclo-ligase
MMVPVPTTDAAKSELRARLRTDRRARSAEDRARVAGRLTALVLALPELDGAMTVAAYVSGPAEPSTALLIDALAGRGVRVLLPVLRPDLDLDWAAYTGPEALAPSPVDGRSGLLEPVGERLGVDAVSEAALLLVPALAVDGAGARLGQGGGSYDRALVRVFAGTPVAALLYEGELLDRVPAEPHDRPVTLAVLPSGVVRFSR